MTRFNINTDATRATKDTLLSASTAVREAAQKSYGASATVAEVMSGPAAFQVSGRIDAAANALLNKAAQMDSLAAALETIVTAYENGDEGAKSLLQSSAAPGITLPKPKLNPVVPHPTGPAIAKDIINRIIKWISDILKPKVKEPVTREQERANDLALQDAAFALLETDRFSEETWNKASIKERKKILEELSVALAAVMGIPTPNVIFKDFHKTSTTGYFSEGEPKSTVAINTRLLKGDDSYDLTTTMIHEMRHAYQYQVVTHPDKYQVSPETVAQWKNNFEPGNYRSPGEMGPNGRKYEYEDYITQPIEWDAKNFARQEEDYQGYTPDYEGSWPVQ